MKYMSQSLLQRLVRSAMHIGASPSDSDDTRLQKTLLVLSSLMMASLAVAWGSIYVVFGERLAGAIPLSYALLSFLSIIAFARTGSYRSFRFSQLLLSLLLPFFRPRPVKWCTKMTAGSPSLRDASGCDHRHLHRLFKARRRQRLGDHLEAHVAPS